MTKILSNGNGGEPIAQPMSREESLAKFAELHALLDRVEVLLLSARAKHEAEVARRSPAALPIEYPKLAEGVLESWRQQMKTGRGTSS